RRPPACLPSLTFVTICCAWPSLSVLSFSIYTNVTNMRLIICSPSESISSEGGAPPAQLQLVHVDIGQPVARSRRSSQV
ncbi:hypothetical protein K443DRAFT_649387, partial [Laccaria amethystina LaAM-08-1]